jgi:rubrerythrin
MIEEGLTSLEALGIAIRCEMDAEKLYENLAQKTENELMKERFQNLSQAQKKHRLLLEKKYQEMFPNVELRIPTCQLPQEVTEERIKNLTLREILKIAIEQEKKAREFFLDCAETVTDLSGKRMFRFLADMKFSYSNILKTELEVIEKYPAYYEEQGGWEVETRLKTDKMKK